MPFKGWKKNYTPIGKANPKGNLSNVSSAAGIVKALKHVNDNMPHIKNIILDDFQYMASFEYFDRAKEKGYETVILTDDEGNITEGPGFNVFAVKDKTLITTNHGSLEGISRKTIIEIATELNMKVETRSLSYSEFMNSDEVFLSSSGGGVIPLTKVDDRIFSNGSVGPITEKLHNNYWQFVQLNKYRTNIKYH